MIEANLIAKSNDKKTAPKPFFLWRHLNKLRWLSLTLIFSMLIMMPVFTKYQNFVAAHAYDLLTPSQKTFYDAVEAITSPFTSNPEKDLDFIKGSTWSGNFFGYKISDPLAVIGQSATTLKPYWPFVVTAFIPIIATLLFGRFFCGWICPATFLYELNSNLVAWLQHHGLRFNKKHIDTRLKYLVLILGLLISALTGVVWVASIYPPAIIGREFYYALALGGFGSGMIFFLITLVLDIFVQRRAFCRYLCPGGALYSLLGRFRPFRIQRVVSNCNDCAKCNVICEFGLDPMNDHFGQECNNCTACIAVCPVDALTFVVAVKDQTGQGPGHQGQRYRKNHTSSTLEKTEV